MIKTLDTSLSQLRRINIPSLYLNDIIVCVYFVYLNVNLKHLALLVKLILQFINRTSLGIMYFIQCFVIVKLCTNYYSKHNYYNTQCCWIVSKILLFDTKENDVIHRVMLHFPCLIKWTILHPQLFISYFIHYIIFALAPCHSFSAFLVRMRIYVHI